MGLGIDVGVGGRFHADRLLQALLAQGHDAHLWTSFPGSRFPTLPKDRVHSLLWPELVYRAARQIGQENRGDLFKMQQFGRRLGKRLQGRERDLFIGWSSFSLEALQGPYRHRAVMRDSVHITRQLEILEQEYRREGIRLPDRKRACERELKEYEKADTILVLSEYARRSFIDAGIAPGKLKLLSLGVDTRLFKPVSRDSICLPLKVVYFGSVSVRKGIRYLLDAVAHFSAQEVQWTIIGPVEPGLEGLRARFPQIHWVGAMPQAALAALLPEQDVFVLPTVEDGFGQTLVQAMACGLVPVATDACGAAEVLQNGLNGFRVPAANSDALQSAIAGLVADPQRVLKMRSQVLASVPSLGWQRYETSVKVWVDSLSPLGE